MCKMNPQLNKINEFSMDVFSLKGKVAMITGGNSGIGKGLTLALAKAGADIFVVSIMGDNDITKQLVEKEGVRYHCMIADITEEGVCRKVVEECVNIYGKIDILMNNAGILINEKDVTKFTKAQ